MRTIYQKTLLLALILLIGCAIINFVPQAARKFPVRQGLDLSGGTRAVLLMKQEAGSPAITSDTQQQVVNVMDKRVNALGVAEPVIQAKGSDQIVVEMPTTPGKTPKQRQDDLLDLIRPAKLEFIWLSDVRRDAAMGGESAGNPTARYIMEGPTRFKDADTGQYLTDAQIKSEILYKNKENVIVTGADLKPSGAQVDISPRGGVETRLQFNEVGTRKFARFTTDHIGALLAIVLNEKIDSAPRINDAITDGTAVITGGANTVQEAQGLADLLNAGALPVPLEVASISDVEATLGQGAVDDAIRGGIVGFIAIAVFMLFYYSLPGAVAVIALLVYTIITFTIFRLMGVTLTLPGIAGFILSIGMAVDANILIFERMKEELRAGRTLHAAVDAGFDRAWTSIRDSNVSTLITCVILYSFGSGPIRGFALVLALGVLVSLFSAITVSRALLHVFVNQEWAQNPKFYRVGIGWGTSAEKKHWDIMGRWRLWFTISALLIGIGWAFVVLHAIKSPTNSLLTYGIDFTGGTDIRYQLPADKPASDADIRGVFAANGLEGVSVQRTVGENIITVRTKVLDPQKNPDIAPNLLTAMQKQFGPETRQLEFNQVGPTMSNELKWNAFWSVLLACLMILLYLAFVFGQFGFTDGLKYGTAAVIALVHDVLVIIGFMGIMGYLLGWEVNALFVTAALTIIGFSVHDTIVVFDRIRENMKLHGKEWSFHDVANASIIQTIGRSINTTMTVVITLFALLLFTGGSPDLRVFTSVLLLGIISGTYSSIFNATPILALWEVKHDKKRVVPAKKQVVVDNTRAIVTPGAAQPTTPKPASTVTSETDAAKKAKPEGSKKQKRRF